jgi:DNA adenine methylase
VQSVSPIQAKPFLKWAGGKGQLLPELLQRLPPKASGAYHEPFVGGGALFFALASQGLLTTACLSDANQPLIDAYLTVRDDVEGVIRRLRKHVNEEAYFYRIREQNPNRLSAASQAARLIYLNKTCFNGLYRENRAGKFNVPFGRYKSPAICDEENLRAVAAVLDNADISCQKYKDAVRKARKGDFVYFDPPYDPLTKTSSFTAYDRNPFTKDDQAELRDTFAALAGRGVYVMLSNSDTPFIRELYAEFDLGQVLASRLINSKADRRGKISELVIRNYR